MSLFCYLDWNIFNKIEKVDQLEVEEKQIYSKIKNAINNSDIVVPYSNAHISDLARGYLKNPLYTEEHIKTIEILTKKLCIVQFWGEPKVKLHYRDPKEFLDSTLEESEITSKSFSELLYMDDQPLLNVLWDVQKKLLKFQKVDDSFKEIYKVDPIFNQIFSRTKVEMNLLALCEDIYQFSFRIKTDYALYKHFQKFLTQLRLTLPQYQKIVNKTQHKVIGKPRHLTWDNLVDESTVHFENKSKNESYDKIVNLFTITDLKGYSPDERFANLIDDALHCFYAAQFNYFVTIDKRCSNKAKLVYEKLKINCLVVSPQDFFSVLENLNK